MSERSFSQKLVDNVFAGAPYGWLTSDRGVELSQLSGLKESLDPGLASLEREIGGLRPGPVIHRDPIYLPTPEVYIDTSELAFAQHEVADRLSDVIDAQRDLVDVANSHTPLFHRLIQNQGVSNELLSHLNQAAVSAYHQRNQQIDQLAQLISNGHDVADGVRSLDATVAYEASATRDLLQRLFADIGESVVALNKEQVVTRMALLQELYQIRSTFLRNHHEAMLAQQQQLGLLNRILQASLMTERQKESHHLWKQAEAKRRRARTDEDYQAVLALLGESQHLDPLNPAPFMSAGSVYCSLGHDGLAATAFTEADALIEDNPFLASFNLISLADVLVRLERYDHAERVMRKATRLDPGNNEVWYAYAKAAWRSGKQNEAAACLTRLIQKNARYYRAQLAVDPIFSDLFTMITRS